MKLVHLLLSSVCLLMIPAGLTAQRPDFGPFRDSLNTLTDIAELQRRERALQRPDAAATVDPIIRRGLIGLRLWTLTGEREHARRAVETFEAGAERFPGEPWTHYGLALALARGPEARLALPGGVADNITIVQSVAEIIGRDPRSRSRRAARRALEADPAFAPAAVLLGELALADGGRSRDAIRDARDALLRVRAAGGATPEADRAIADLEIALGNYQAAGEAAAAGGDHAGALRSRAVALLLQQGRENDGAAIYWQGVERLDSDAAAQYYADVEVLSTPQEDADWRVSGGTAGQRIWLERFWSRRAAEGGVSVAERLAEHYRRLARARSLYLRNSVRGTDQGALLTDERNRFPFDDRGVVLIRHGEPFAVVRSSGRALLPNESWAYDLPDQGRQIFHFAALRGAQSFTLISDLFEALDPRATLYGDERDRAMLTLVGDRANIEPRYQAIQTRLQLALRRSGDPRGTEIRSVMESVDAEYRRGVRQALLTDTHVRSYRGELDYHHDVFSFRTPLERTELTAAFAIPARQLEPVAGSGGTAYDVALSVILQDTLQDVVTRRDTLLRVQRTPGDEHVRAHVTLPVVPSEHTVYRLVAEDAAGGRGRLVSGGSVLRDFSGRDLLVSDVVLALPDSAGDWVRGDTRLALALPRSFAPERPFTVFYEVYNLPAQAPYSTRIVVEPVERGGLGRRVRGLFGGRSPGRIDLSFEDVARPGSDGVLQESRRVASDLPAGSYRMVLTVTSEGRTASTETLFSVER